MNLNRNPKNHTSKSLLMENFRKSLTVLREKQEDISVSQMRDEFASTIEAAIKTGVLIKSISEKLRKFVNNGDTSVPLIF